MHPRQNGPRYKNGKLIPARYRTSLRISQEDLEAGIYPEGDVRNQPDVRRRMEEIRGSKLVLPRGLPPVPGAGRCCPTCGRHSGV